MKNVSLETRIILLKTFSLRKILNEPNKMRSLAGNFQRRWVSLLRIFTVAVPLGCTLFANEEQTRNYSLSHKFNVYKGKHPHIV